MNYIIILQFCSPEEPFIEKKFQKTKVLITKLEAKILRKNHAHFQLTNFCCQLQLAPIWHFLNQRSRVKWSFQ